MTDLDKIALENEVALTDLIETDRYEIPPWVRTCLRGIRQNSRALAKAVADEKENARRAADPKVIHNFNIPDIDGHPLRYTKLVHHIEQIVFEREMIRDASQNGFVPGTLPTAILIAETVFRLLEAKLLKGPPDEP